jgi:hypothetical protein
MVDPLLRGGGSQISAYYPGANVLIGGPGRDRLIGKYGTDVMRARDGQRDWVNGRRGIDRGRWDRHDIVKNVEMRLK